MKVHINREECIECGSCESLCPQVFVVDWGSGSSIKEEYRTDDPAHGKVGEDLEGCVTEAEENCPVEVISTE
jgi:ferredoxin